MPVYTIARIKIKNGAPEPVADAGDLRGGMHVVSTLAERDSLPAYLLQAASTLCWVGGEINALFQLGEDGVTWVSIPFASVLDGDVTGASTANSVDKIKGVAYNTPPQIADGYVMTYVVPAEGDPYWTALAPSFSDLGGDVTGAAGNNTVENLQSIPLDLSGEPDAGMVLTYEEEPAPHLTLKSPAAPQLAGDVSGASDNNTVDKIKNLPVQVSPEVSPGQALIYSIEPEPHLEFGSVASSDLSGDVTGTFDSNKVEKIQNISVAEPGEPDDGMVLTYVQEPEPHLALKYPEAQTMFGDVSGSTDNNTVDKIKNIPVSVSPEISPGQALVYSIDPEPHFEFDTVASGNLAGDVTGAAANNTVEKIKNILVDINDEPETGQILTYTKAVGEVPATLSLRTPAEAGITKLTGDVTAAGQGTVQATVTAIQGQAVSTTVPSSTSNLAWNTHTKAWEPQIPANPPILRQIPADQYTQLWYKFDETAAPYKNSGLAGTLDFTAGAGAVLNAREGVFGRAVHIVSGNSLASPGTALGESNSATISIWVNPSGFVDYGMIVSKFYGATWSSPYATLYIQLSGVAGAWSCGATVGGNYYDVAVTAAQDFMVLRAWNHMALTFDATTGLLNAYINGSLVATRNTPVGNLDWGQHGPWVVGGLTYNATRVVPGRYDDFRVENTVRSAGYIKEMYRRGMGLHDSTAGLTIIEQGVQEWVVAKEIDFTQLTTQPFAADGNYTIDGATWKVENKASATSMGIVNGSGLVIACNSAGSVYNGSTRTAPLVTVPVSSFVPALGGNPRIRVLAQISVSGANAGYESGGLVIESTASPRFFNMKIVKGYNSDVSCVSALRTVNSVSSADFKNTYDYANRDIVGFEFVDPITVDALNGVFGPNVLWPEFVDGGSTGAWRHSVLNLTDAQAGISNQFASLAQLSLGFVAHTGTANGTLTLTVKKLRIEYLGVVAGAESSRMPQDQYSFLEYYFDETSGTTIYNKVPTTGAIGNMTVSVATGLQVGSPAPLFGRGLALSDDATKHRRVVGPTGSQLTWPSGDFTVAVWCTVTERGLADGNGFIAGKAYKEVSAPDGSYSFWMWFQESGPHIHYGVKRSAGDHGSSVHLDFFKVPMHVPHLIGLTYVSSTGTISLWVDGVLAGSYSQGSGPVDWGAAGPLNIGDYPVSSNVVYSIGGVIEGLRIDACARPAQWWREAWQRCGGRGSIVGAGGSAGVVRMAGDVTGTSAISIVSKLQGKAVASSAPTDKQLLQWNAGTTQWEPTAPSAAGNAGGDLTGTYPNPTVAKLQGRALSNAAPGDTTFLGWSTAVTKWEPTVLGLLPPAARRPQSDGSTTLWFKLDETQSPWVCSKTALQLTPVSGTGAGTGTGPFGTTFQQTIYTGGGIKSADTSVGEVANEISGSAWVWIDNSTAYPYRTILRKYNNIANEFGVSVVLLNGAGAALQLTVGIKTANWQSDLYLGLSGAVRKFEWNLIAFTYSVSTRTLNVYSFNSLGVLTASQVAGSYGPFSINWGNHGPWSIGGPHDGSTSPFVGLISDVRIENTIRAQAYYQAMYNAGASTPTLSDKQLLTYHAASKNWISATAAGDVAPGELHGELSVVGLRSTAIYDFSYDECSPGDVLTWTKNGWTPLAIPEGSSEVSGDVTGTVPGQVEVVGLRSTAIYDFTPDALSVGEVLTWTKNGWAPAEVAAYVEVQDAAGSALAHRQAIQFKGTAVTSVTDDLANDRTIVQVDGGEGSSLKVGNVTDVSEIAFTIVGSDLSCDVTDSGGGKATVVLTHASGGSGGAPTGASYVTMGSDGTLSAERVLTAGLGISVTDGGANKNVTIAASLTAGAGISIAQDGTALKITNTAGGASGMTGIGGDVEAGDKSTTATLKAIQGDPLNLVGLQDGDLLVYSSPEGDDPEWSNISSKITLDGDAKGYGFPGGEISTSVVGLRGKEVSSTAPTLNQVLSYSGSKWAPVTVPGALPVHFGYRASLSASSVVPMVDVTSTTLYFYPYASNILTLYTGGTNGWRSYSPGIFSVTPLLDGGVGVYDVFLCTTDNGVTFSCVTYKREANGTPGVAIPFTDGARTLGINKTMLWVAAVLAVDDEGTMVMRDTPEVRGLWNVYNRVERELCTPLVTGAYGSWVYDSAVWRATEDDALFNNFKVVTGIDGEVLHARATSLVALSFAAQHAAAGIGIDSTSVNSARTYGSAVKNADATVPVAISAEVDCPMAQGGHTVYWLERGSGLFYYNYTATCQAGMHGWIRM